jgi:hypothetical protein
MRPQSDTTLFELNVCVGFELLLPLSIYFEPSIVIILFEIQCIWTKCKLYVSMWTVITEPLRSWLYVEKVWDPSRFRRLPGLYGLKYVMTTVLTVVFVLVLLYIGWFCHNTFHHGCPRWTTICLVGTTSLKITGCLAVGSSDPRHVWLICLEKKR